MPVKKYKNNYQARKARVKQINGYLKNNSTSFSFRFMNDKDSAVIEKLKKVSNKSDYIRQLIIKDINSSK